MNVREEDRQRNSCPSLGLGLAAAAAIGVGVSAALYHFSSEGPENPGREGSTSGWMCEEPHAFNPLHGHDDSETTISEHSTTESEAEYSEEFESDWDTDSSNHRVVEGDQSSEWDDPLFDNSHLSISSDDSELNNARIENSHVSISSDDSSDTVVTVFNVSSDSDTMDWDVTSSSIDVPRHEGRSPRSPLMSLFINFGASASSRPEISRQTAEENQRAMLRDRSFRERSYTLEECSICCDIILNDQQVTTLPCTHNFHSACITPWLQEQPTCPNCREAAE